MENNSTALKDDRFLADVIDQGSIGAQQLLVVALCLFFNMLDGFDITAMAILNSAVAEELSLSADRMGWVLGLALAGMMLGAMFLAPISDIVGRRTMVIVSLLLVGASILLTANASSFVELLVLRFTSGLGAGALLASQAALAAEYSPEKYRAFAVAVVTSGYPMGAMMTSVIGGVILPEYGWRGMFWFGGALTALMALVAWLLLPESLKFLLHRRPEGALERVNAVLKKLGHRRIEALPPATGTPPATGFASLGQVGKIVGAEHRKTTVTLWTAFLLSFSTLYFLMSWIPRLMEESGFDAAVGRDAFFQFNLGGVLGIYVLGWLSTRFRLSSIILVLALLASAGMVIFAFAPSQLNILLPLILFIGITQQGAFTGLYSAAAKVYPTDVRSTGIGWGIGLGRLGAVIGPVVAGYLIAAGFGMSDNFLFFAVPFAIGGIIAYRLNVA